jgi:hypothetical protein
MYSPPVKTYKNNDSLNDYFYKSINPVNPVKSSDQAVKSSDQAVCFLCRKIETAVVDFAIELSSHLDVYILSDFEPDFKIQSPNITIINVSDEEVRKSGFHSANTVDWIPKDVMAIDKALYYFCKQNNSKYVWFIEDDVFIPHVDLLSAINSAHPQADLLTKSNISKEESLDWPGWVRSDLQYIDGPYYHSLACAVRLSRKMLNTLSEFVSKNNRLVFIEFMYNTLALKNNLTIETPEALSTIEFRKEYKFGDFNVNCLYHPIKDIQVHPKIRLLLTLSKQS